jgi:adenine-specific DNA glycosylase
MGCGCNRSRHGARTASQWLELAALWDKRGVPSRAEKLRKIAEQVAENKKKENEKEEE